MPGEDAVEILINLLIWAHILAFVAGGSNSVVGPVIAARAPGASPEVRAGYYDVMDRLAQVGKVSMMVLLISGPLILWLKYGGLGGASVWFWIKMALVVVMLVSIISGVINEKKARAGDAAAAKLADIAHMVTGLAFAGVLLSAVLAFA
jgi:putative membrane protein